MSYSFINTYKPKAKSLLLPLLQLSDNGKILNSKSLSFSPKVFLRWEPICGIECMELLLYFNEEGEMYSKFLENVIFSNKRLQSSFDIKEGGDAFVFDISEYWDIVALFIEGKYSKFNKPIKEMIRTFWGDSVVSSSEVQLGHDFKIIFYPEIYFCTAAQELNVTENLLKNVGELMSPPNIVLEQFKLSINKTL